MSTVQTTKQCSTVVGSWEEPPHMWLTVVRNAFVSCGLNFWVRIEIRSSKSYFYTKIIQWSCNTKLIYVYMNKIQWLTNINFLYLHLMKIPKIFCLVSKGRAQTRLKTSWNILFLFMIYFICFFICHTDLSLYLSDIFVQNSKFQVSHVSQDYYTLHCPCSPTDYNWNI